MSRRNLEVAQCLENIAELLAVKGESPFPIRAYANTAQHIVAVSDDVGEV